jgi:thioredoxin 1
MPLIPEITAQTFASEILQSPMPVLVDLFAPWCGPCQMMSGVLERLAPQVAGRVKIVKINTDEQPELAAAFQVSSIPMLALVQDGKVVDAIVGAVSMKTILHMLDKVAPLSGVAGNS